MSARDYFLDEAEEEGYDGPGYGPGADAEGHDAETASDREFIEIEEENPSFYARLHNSSLALEGSVDGGSVEKLLAGAGWKACWSPTATRPRVRQRALPKRKRSPWQQGLSHFTIHL